MPLSSVFEKLKLRRGSNSNPPSPTSSSGIREGRASSDNHHHHNSRKSVDQPRVSSNVSRDAPADARVYGGEQAGESTGFRGQELVGAHNHVDGNTEVARNANAALERDPNSTDSQQSHQAAQAPQHQQRESRDAPRENLDQGHGRTGSGLTGRGEGKGLPPIPGVSGRDDRDHAQHAREPVAAAQRTPSKVPASSRNVANNNNNQFDADGFPIVPKTSSSSSSSKSESGLPRSHGTFALPTVPQTPAFSDEVQAGLLDRSVGGGSAPAPGLRERFELDAGSMGYIPVDEHRHGLGFGGKDVAGSSEKPAEWREIGSGPLIKQHQLTTPRQLAPYKVTDPNVIAEESRRFVTAQSKVGRLEPNHIGTVARGQGERDGELATAGSTQSALSAYIPIREYAFHPSPPGATDPSPEHIQRHLALLSNSFTHSRMSRIGAGASKPGKYTPLIPGIPVSTTERDRELINQREGLVSRIAREETVAERSGARGIKPKNGLDERSVEVFKQAGWESKVGVLDTVDVKSRVLEPVIQEHVAIIETEVYELMIFRDIHKYHIYPFIQPIHDPSPTVLPTRHLFKDAQGQWREVIGDEAAERVLGTKIDRSEGSVYTERWIESVGGIEYEAIEKESVVVGRRGWVQLVGERLVVGNSNSSIGRGHVSSSSRSGSNAMRIATDVESKPRKSSFSATSPGRPVGQRSSRDAPPVPTDHVNSHRSSGQIGRAF